MGTRAERAATKDAVEGLARGFMTSQMLHVAEKLGLADILKEKPARVSELARATGCHPASLARLLRALRELGVLEEDGSARFRLSGAGARLAQGHPASVAPFVIESGARHIQAAWLELAHAVRTGESAFQFAHGTEYATYLDRHPDLVASQVDAVAARLAAEARSLIAAYDFSSVATIVVVGGGRAALLAEILAGRPELAGVLVERPSFERIAASFFARRGLTGRARIVTGDVHGEVPRGGDAYLFAHVIGECSDADALHLLGNCRRAAARDSRLWIVERFAPVSALDDVAKLVLYGEAQHERTRDEVRALIEIAGFRRVQIVAEVAETALLEASPAV